MHTDPTKPNPNPWQQTYMGHRFYPANPKPESIDIRDIAHGLSLLCRFAGQIKRFYSVAEHSLFVANLLPPELKLAGLMHDATEAYLSDVPQPVKLLLPQYKILENLLSGVIESKFKFRLNDPLIKRADDIALMTEAHQLLVDVPEGWGRQEKPMDIELLPVDPFTVEKRFLSAFNHYTYLSNTHEG